MGEARGLVGKKEQMSRKKGGNRGKDFAHEGERRKLAGVKKNGRKGIGMGRTHPRESTLSEILVGS